MIDFINSVSKVLASHQLLLATLGIPLLTLFVTIYVSWRNTKLSAALKVAEMRQAWINNLRNQMVEYSSLSLQRYNKHENLNIGDLAKIDGQITLMMNWEDRDYLELTRKMKVLSQTAMESRQENSLIEDAHNEYITVCQAILKREWDRLKGDLKNKRV